MRLMNGRCGSWLGIAVNLAGLTAVGTMIATLALHHGSISDILGILWIAFAVAWAFGVAVLLWRERKRRAQ